MTQVETLAPKAAEEESQFKIEYKPSEKAMDVIGDVFSKFTESSNNRNQNFAYFDGRNLIDYIDDNVLNFTTNINERDDIEDWQARVHGPFTRNKVISVLGKVAPVIPVSEIFARGDEDIRRSQITSDLYNYSNDVDDNDELMFYALLEAIVKGTIVGYEGYEEKDKIVRDLDNYDSAVGGTLKKDTIKIKKVFGAIVPLEDFYPSSAGIRRIKDMPFCFWRTIMSEPEFYMFFSKYPNSEFVEPFGGSASKSQEDRPFYKDYITDSIPEGAVEIIRYYNQDTDEFVIIANGVWLNLLKDDEVMPIPFKHKKLPFWKAVYEPFGIDFFYGKAMPDKLKASQDVMDVLNNMMLDQSFLSIFKPILVGGSDSIEDDYLRPGRRIGIDDADNFKELDISAPQGFHQFILEFTKRTLEETSLDPVSQGTAGSKGGVTATEIRRAAQGVVTLLGLFVTFIKWGVRDKDRLRIANILQFYDGPLTERILGEGGSSQVKKAFNTFRVDGATLSSGKRGTKIIEMFKDKSEMPKRGRLIARAKLIEKETGKRFEIVAITAQYIRNFEFDLRLVPNPKTETSKELEQALEIEKQKTYNAFYPDLLDREEAAARLAEKFGDRPEKIFKKEVFNPLAKPKTQQPQGSTASNLSAGAAGGQQGALAIRDMDRELTGEF